MDPQKPGRERKLTAIGNYGGSAGIAEILLQSHAGTVHLLPAKFSIYGTGSVTGLMARGGFQVGIQWAGGRLVEAKILSKLGNPLNITVADNQRFTVTGGTNVGQGTTQGVTYTVRLA